MHWIIFFECFNFNFHFWNILYWKLFVTSLTESLALCWSDNYVHRLVASKTDGKMVQYECEGDRCQDEKIDALQLEVCVCVCVCVCVGGGLLCVRYSAIIL